MAVKQRIRDYFTRKKPLAPGLYDKRIDNEFGNFRLHLRVEAGGEGTLIINASKMIHLNHTGTELAKLIMDGLNDEQIVNTMKQRYRVGGKQVSEDLAKIRDMVHILTSTDDVCPITYLDVDRIEPFSSKTIAPYRMDLALTYECQNKCPHCYVGKPRKVKELTTEQWKEVIKHCWEEGIPHICFTGGEPTLREDLRQLVEYAEDLGVVTGLLTNGRKLSDKGYLDGLVQAGIDHFQITLESHDESIHDLMVGDKGAWRETVAGIKNALTTPVYTITNTTLTRHNVPTIEETVDFLASLGLEVIAANGIICSGHGKGYSSAIAEEELTAVLARILSACRRNHLRFIWYTPTQYCRLNPLKLELGIKQCTAGKYNMCIEPDGEVLPCQSYYKSLGNILKDDWKSIWHNPILESLRRREFLMEKCKDCSELEVCGGGCPLALSEEDLLYCLESGSNA
jgi:radical SAM protein with 4Fe4S-binding SPASM domain